MGAIVEEKNVGVGSAEVGVEDGGLDKGGAWGATVGCVLADEVSERAGSSHFANHTGRPSMCSLARAWPV